MNFPVQYCPLLSLLLLLVVVVIVLVEVVVVLYYIVPSVTDGMNEERENVRELMDDPRGRNRTMAEIIESDVHSMTIIHTHTCEYRSALINNH